MLVTSGHAAGLRERVALLKDIPVGVVDGLIADTLTLTPGGRTLVRTMAAHGAHTCLVSGGFTLFTSLLLDEAMTNGCEVLGPGTHELDDVRYDCP